MRPRLVLPIIVVSQFFCTSLWFAGNAVIVDISTDFRLDAGFLANLTSAIQFGFITGTLTFAVLTISDRFSPSWVFFISSLLAGFFNLGITLLANHPTEILLLRFLTGFFLAGIYPVGMKIASDYYQAGLGKSLGFLVGALVLGTAFPHALRISSTAFPWKYVLYGTSALSVVGGLLILWFVPNGPYRRPSKSFNLATFARGFKHAGFRSASFGYFGHMWELYTFWAFVPIMLTAYNARYPTMNLNVSMLSFTIIASGSVACVLSGILSQYIGIKRLAIVSLSLSGACCLASPLFLFSSSLPVLLSFLLIWGLFVIADSPLFSTLVAQHAPAESRGTSLTIVNCIGFAITIASIQFITMWSGKIAEEYLYMLLAIGPILGLVALLSNRQNIRSSNLDS